MFSDAWNKARGGGLPPNEKRIGFYPACCRSVVKAGMDPNRAASGIETNSLFRYTTPRTIMPPTVTHVDVRQQYIRGVIDRADHHAGNINEARCPPVFDCSCFPQWFIMPSYA
jgi:hypothetical protein